MARPRLGRAFSGVAAVTAAALLSSGLYAGFAPAASAHTESAAESPTDAAVTSTEPVVEATKPIAGAVDEQLHLDGIPKDARFEPVPTPDMSGWYAVPVNRERVDGGPSTPALDFIEIADYGVTVADLTAAGIPVLPYAKAVALTARQIASAAIDEDVLNESLTTRSTNEGFATAAAIPSGSNLTLAVYYDTSQLNALNGTTTANNAWSRTVTFYQEKHGIPLNRFRLLQGTQVPYYSDVQNICHMQTLARWEMGYSSASRGLVIVSNGKVTVGSQGDAHGVAIDGNSSVTYSWGETKDHCAANPDTAPKITPAVIPSMYVGGFVDTTVPTFIDIDKTGVDYVMAHELGHFLAMEHNMARCWTESFNHKHKTLESFTSASDGRPECNYYWGSDAHYHWYFNDHVGGVGEAAVNGVTAINNEWDRYANCRSNGWCTTYATPSAATNLVAQSGNGSVTLSWNAPVHKGGGSSPATSVDGYCVFQGTSPNFLVQQPVNDSCLGNVTSTTITGLTNGTRYYFYVRARNGWGWGPKGSEANAMPVVPNLTSTTITSKPSYVTPGQTFSVCWQVNGAGGITTTNLEYGATSGLGSATGGQSGNAPQSFCASLVAPSSGSLFFRSRATGPANTVYSSITSVPVYNLTSTSFTSIPSSVQPNQSYQVCWDVYGAGTISHTDLHYGTSTSLGSATSVQTGNAPQNFCATLTAPLSGTHYVQAHAQGPAGSAYTNVASVPVQSVSQNDCGIGGDAGGSHATASSITLPKSNCSGSLATTTDTEDWYQFSVTAGQQISASMTPNSSADFDICLWNPSGAQVVSCTTGSNGTTDSFTHTAVATGNYRLQVKIYSGTGSYTTSVSAATPANDCGTGGDAGGSHATASSITLPKSNCSGSLNDTTDTEDWYQFSVTSGQSISTSVVPNSGADFDLCLHDPAGNSVGCATAGTGATDTVTYTANTTGSWRARVYRYGGTGTYTFSASASGGGGPVTVRDDDGEKDADLPMNHTDDTAVKRLNVTSAQLSGKTTATLYVYGQSYACTATGNKFRLVANDTTVVEMNPCDQWSQSAFGWKAFNVSINTILAGTNTFSIKSFTGDWNSRNLLLGVDTDTDHGRSDTVYDGTSMNGELMWYLVLS